MKAQELAFKNINLCLSEEPIFCGGAWVPQGGPLRFCPMPEALVPATPGSAVLQRSNGDARGATGC